MFGSPTAAPRKARRASVRCRVLPPIVSIAVLYPATCLAYFDPNAGGWLFQLLFPVIVALGGAWVLFKARVQRMVGKLRRRHKERE